MLIQKSTVINKVEGQEVYTRIEVEANGQKKILESNQPGKHEVEIKNSGSSPIQATVKSTIIATSSSIPRFILLPSIFLALWMEILSYRSLRKESSVVDRLLKLTIKQLWNNVSSSAVSGQNEIITAGQGSIVTGDSQSTVNVVNFVNTNIADMLFQYLFINTFGSWGGDFLGWNDILAAQGGGSLTLTSIHLGDSNNGCPFCATSADINNQAYVVNNISSTASTGGNYILGGAGSIKTFSVSVKNTGTGKVYGAKARISFIQDGVDMGGAIFNLGDIEAGKSMRLTTGLVLSATAPAGLYIARVRVFGFVGPDNRLVSDYDDSTFLIKHQAILANSPPEVLGLVSQAYAVEGLNLNLGDGIPKQGWSMEDKMRLFFLGCVLAYLLTKGVQKRQKLLMSARYLKKITGFY